MKQSISSITRIFNQIFVCSRKWMFATVVTFSMVTSQVNAQSIAVPASPKSIYGYQISKFIVDNVFDGGTDLRSDVTTYDYWEGSTATKIHMTFHGNYVYSNFYETTLVFSSEAPYVRFENTNDQAKAYILLVGINETVKWIGEYSQQYASN